MAWRCLPKGISTMPAHFRVSSLVPSGLIVDSVAHIEDTIIVTARAGIEVAMCPLCRSPSRRVHSRYVRQVSDLPCSGRSVCLRVVTRRFCCERPHCRRRIFAERFDEAVLLVRSRRTRGGSIASSIILAWLSAAGRQRASPSALCCRPAMIPFSASCDPVLAHVPSH